MTHFNPNDAEKSLNLIAKLNNKLEQQTNYNTKENFLKAQAGDQTIRNAIIAYNMRLVVKLVKPYQKTQYVSFEDFISIGTIGLIKAVDSFDCTQSYKFSTYATRCINNEIWMFFRTNKSLKLHACYFDQVISVDTKGNDLTLADVLYDEKQTLSILNIEDSVDLKTLLKRCVDNKVITPKELHLLNLRFGLEDGVERSIQQVMEQANIKSYSYMCRAIKKAINKIQDYSISCEENYKV